MSHHVHSGRPARARRSPGRRGPAHRARAPQPTGARRPRVSFFGRSTQQVTSGRAVSIRLGDVAAAGATLGALMLWGMAIHLLG
jgi:hypothetical protein